jgi:hypothetical protein
MADRSSSEVTVVPLPEEGARPFVSCSPKKLGNTLSPLPHHGHSSESACSDSVLDYPAADKRTRLPCTCPSCPRHSSPAKPGDNRLVEFMRRSALHRINAAIPQSGGAGW